jgi:hypothetical protein
MDRFNYQSKWDEKELNKFKVEDFNGLNVNDFTIGFLTNIGLPDSAAPFLSFDRQELKTIKEIYDTQNESDRFLIDIGSDGAGDPICIDTKNNCEIVALDHEDNFARRFTNSSVDKLFAFLTIYKEFGDNLILLRGDTAFIDSNFLDEDLEGLLIQLKLVDKRALDNDETFWNREIEMFKANRGVE